MKNLKSGIVGIWHFDTVEEFENDYNELINNPDFILLGHYDMTQDADEELQHQGFTLEEIAKMSMAQYGNVIETLQDPETNTYTVFVGAR